MANIDKQKETGISPLHRRPHAEGKRSIKLTKKEQLEIKRHTKILRAVEMFLDVNVSHSWEDIAKEIGVTTRTLKNMVKEEEFIQAYNEYYDELTSDPRRRASIISLNNLLPKAISELEKLITEDGTPPSVKFQAIKEVIHLNNVSGDVGKKSDRNELAEFLKGVGVVNFNINQTPAHKHFDAKIKEHGYEHAIDAEFVEGEFEEVEEDGDEAQ